LTDFSLLDLIYQSLLETWRATRVVVPGEIIEGYLDLECAFPWMSLAQPLRIPETVEDAIRAVDALRVAFRESNRGLRFEFFEEQWPGLAAMLETAGLIREEEHPLLVCRRDQFRPRDVPDAGIEVLDRKVSLDTLVSFVHAQRRAYGFSGSAEEAGDEALWILRDIESGRMTTAVARVGSSIVGTAAAIGVGAVREIASVCTVPEMRKQGIALAVSAAVVAWHFTAGGSLAWLTAGSPEAERIYARLGFKRVGATQVNLSDPSPALSE
jgi:GNAT superfamily N-acetyltransferase